MSNLKEEGRGWTKVHWFMLLRKMYLCIVILPLLGSFVAGLFGRFVGSTGASLITTSCLYLALFFSLVCFYEVRLCGAPCHISAGS